MKPEERLKLLEDLTRIHSGSRNAPGVDRVQAVLADRLRALGFAVKLIENPDPRYVSGKLLIADLPGRSGAFVSFVTHADTVEGGEGPHSLFQYDSAGGVAIGPGALDDKGGQVIAIDGIARYLESLAGRAPAHGLRFISSPSEELGSPGFGPIFAQLGHESLVALGFEPALDQGDLIESRRGNRWYRIEVQGRSGHSGRAHRHGINAAHELVRKLSRIQEMTDYSRDVTVSVGSLKTSTDTYNVIPDHAEAKVDTRFSSLAERDALHSRIEAVIFGAGEASPEDGLSAQSRFVIDDDCPPFSVEETTRALITAYQDRVQSLEGRRPGAQRSGGAADCCYMSRPGLMVIDGLGPIGGQMHSAHEFVSLTSLETRAEALHRFLIEVIEQLPVPTL